MQDYLEQAAKLLGDAVAALKRLDALTEREPSHRLDRFEPLLLRLEQIHRELRANKLAAATRRTHDLTIRLMGGLLELENPAYRSAVASALAQYRQKPKPKHSRLGALRGGRPRKDGSPPRTMERKGYTLESLPQPKQKGVRTHPDLREARRSSGGEQSKPKSESAQKEG